MKIIKAPNQRVSCPKCHAVIEIEREDIQRDDIGHRPAFYILCPVDKCGTSIDVRAQSKLLGVTE